MQILQHVKAPTHLAANLNDISTSILLESDSAWCFNNKGNCLALSLEAVSADTPPPKGALKGPEGGPKGALTGALKGPEGGPKGARRGP